MASRALTRLRKLCLSLPEAHEVEAWGEPTFRVRNKMFATFANGATHHGRGRHAVWCAAPPGHQLLMITAAPDVFFAPPYVGSRGWVGIWLDGDADWTRITGVLEDAYRHVAPKKLAAQLAKSGEV
jgi:hypothetical protein